MSTLNRRPFSVASPSSASVKNYFYTNNGFKGLCTSKNFETVDQDTFEDCNNVYVNKYGLLRSRPSVKKTGQTNVYKMWDFGSTNVVLDTSHKVTITQEGFDTQEHTFGSNDVTPILYRNAIYFFERGQSAYYKYDLATGSFGADPPYVPITRLWREGVYTSFEKPNALTTSERSRYFISDQNVSIPELVGKTVTVYDGNDSYGGVPFGENFAKGLSKKTMEVPKPYGEDSYAELDVSEDNAVALITIWNNEDVDDRTKVSYYVSYDFKTTKFLTEISSIADADYALKSLKGTISRDGLTVFYVTCTTTSTTVYAADLSNILISYVSIYTGTSTVAGVYPRCMNPTIQLLWRPCTRI